LPRASSPDWRNSSGNFTTIPEYFKNRGYMTAGIGKIFHPRFASGEIPADPSSCPVCRGSHDADYSWTEPYFYTESGPHEYSDTRATSWIAAPSDKGPLVDERVRDRAIQVLGNISARRAAGHG
jgi:iduronate 2-sulfatase